MTNKPILSICIPTYNRKYYLKKLLNNIFSQKINTDSFEVVISDNDSNDWTDKMVNLFLKKYDNIVYIKNNTNLWCDKNILNVVKSAKWKYCWLFWDDDIIIDWSIQHILDIVLDNIKNNIWLFFLNYISNDKPIIRSITHDFFSKNAYIYMDYIINRIKKHEMDPLKFTFLSSLIINKDSRDNTKNKEKYIWTWLLHTYTILDFILSSPIYFVSKPLLIQNNAPYRWDVSISKEYLVAKAWIKIYILFSKIFSKHRWYFYKLILFHYIEYIYNKYFSNFKIFKYLLGLFKKFFSSYFYK